MALEEPSGDAEADPVAATRDLIDADSTSERNGMREKLLRKLEDPDSTLREAETQAAILNGAQALLSSDVMKSHVVRPMTGDIAAERTGLLDAPAGLEPHLPQWLDFLSAIADPRSSVAVETFSEQTIVQQLVPPFRTALWFPEDKGTPVARAVDEDAGPLEPRPDWLLLHSAPAHRNRGSDTALRLDVASAVSPEALSVFSREPAAGAAEEE